MNSGENCLIRQHTDIDRGSIAVSRQTAAKNGISPADCLCGDMYDE